MQKLIARASLLLLAATIGCAPAVKEAPPAPPPPAVSYPVVGRAAMDPHRSIIDNIRHSQDHRTLVAALDAAGLAETLAQPGPFTLFAPTDAAFAQLPNGTVEALMHPRSRTEMVGLLNYHIVPGVKTRAGIMADIRAGGGRATYRTMQGAAIGATMEGETIILTDVHGRQSAISQADALQANGVVHVVNGVLLPPA